MATANPNWTAPRERDALEVLRREVRGYLNQTLLPMVSRPRASGGRSDVISLAEGCGELLVEHLASDSAKLGLEPTRVARLRAYVLGVAIAWTQLDLTEDSEDAKDEARHLTAKREQQNHLKSLLALAGQYNTASQSAVSTRFELCVPSCLMALRNELDGGDETLRMVSPVLELAQIYEALLVDGQRSKSERSARRRRLRLLTPLRALSYVRQPRNEDASSA